MIMQYIKGTMPTTGLPQINEKGATYSQEKTIPLFTERTPTVSTASNSQSRGEDSGKTPKISAAMLDRAADSYMKSTKPAKVKDKSDMANVPAAITDG